MARKLPLPDTQSQVDYTVSLVGADGSTSPTQYIRRAQVEALGYDQVDDLSSVVSLEPPAGTTLTVIQVEGQSVRWRDDGEDPSASVGMRITTSGEMRYDGDVSAVRFIEEQASAKMNVSYYA